MAYMNRSQGSWKPVNYSAYELAQIAQAEQDQENEADARYERDQERRAAIHTAYRGMANHMETENDEYPTNDEVAVFVLDMIAKIGKKATDEVMKQELRTIYRDVRGQGADAYGQHKTRLQQLVKAVK